MSDEYCLEPDLSVVSIVDEMKRSYLDYAMSVIVSRALPDVRDGLKPVHRRILFSMYESGYNFDKPYRKSARVVGEVMGKYHPHGDNAIYDALVRMAQSFSMELLLVDGHGNFGSTDGDAAAAMRYTEVRLAEVTNSLLGDLDRDTVDFVPNYDGSEIEPSVLPARFPNLLVNGAGGIAVGMATIIPSHNLGEVIAAVVALIKDPDLSVDELIRIMPGPDFPTGGIVLGNTGIRDYYCCGRGLIILRGRVNIEQIRADHEAIVITELPYQVNKANMVARISDLVMEKKVEGIAEVRDESDRDGCRVVIELKRDASSDITLNQLYRFSALQSSIGVNAVALNGGKPALMNLREMLLAFIDFRKEVVSRRTRFLLRKARERAHFLVGLAIAIANIDEVVLLVRGALHTDTAKQGLVNRTWPVTEDMVELIALIADPAYGVNENGAYQLSDVQASAILGLRLQRLTALGRDDIADELRKLSVEIIDYLGILDSRGRLCSIVSDELDQLSVAFASSRRTSIVDIDGEVTDEELILCEDMVVTVTYAGWIKRVPLAVYRSQRRGGKGRSGVSPRNDDFVTRLFIANTHTQLLCFSSYGQVYTTKLWRVPLASPQARGTPLINLFPLKDSERITSIMAVPENESQWDDLYLMFATTYGLVRRNKLSDFMQVNRAGKIAMKLEGNESIVAVEICTEQDDVLLTTTCGRCIRFPVSSVRVFKGRDSRGVCGISLSQEDTLISMAIIKHFKATPEERLKYLRSSRAMRGSVISGEDYDAAEDFKEPLVNTVQLSKERYSAIQSAEQFIVTLSENGYGKRTSSLEYRITSRGGRGIIAMASGGRNGKLVASFPVAIGDQVVLVTDGGRLIRCPVDNIRIAGRSTHGVIVFNTSANEKVVAVERVSVYDAEVEVEEDE